MEREKELLGGFENQDALVRRRFTAGKKDGMIIYNPDLTDAMLVAYALGKIEEAGTSLRGIRDLIACVLPVAETKQTALDVEAIDGLLSGDAVVFLGGVDGYAIVNVRKYEKRAVSEPPTSNVMIGPREGFVEDLKTNLSLIQRRLRTPRLGMEKIKVGRLSSTTVAVVYIATVADSKVVEKVIRRIESIDVDGIIDSNYVREYLEERPTSIFPQSSVTEKPDVVCAKLLEGRVAVVVDGSPMVLTVPFMLVEDFQSGEDYYERPSFATFLRLIRVIGLFTAVFLPGLYVALQVFHFNIIPLRFILTLMSSVNGIPFKPLAETLFVIFLFELIREAGVRTPRAVGMATSIVGALVLGDTAVKAGIISSPAVMIVALSSLALYTVPNQVGTMSLLRVFFTLLAGAGGLYLMLCGVMFFTAYLTSLDGYSTPYLAPLSPFIKSDVKDSVVKVSFLRMQDRPKSIPGQNKRRRK